MPNANPLFLLVNLFYTMMIEYLYNLLYLPPPPPPIASSFQIKCEGIINAFWVFSTQHNLLCFRSDVVYYHLALTDEVSSPLFSVFWKS
jgi:hypothetical protein